MFSKIATIGLVLGLTTPAMACDMHGGGMFWTPSSQWKSFSPQMSTIDPAYLNSEDSTAFDETSLEENLVYPALRKARPSFSSAADRASRAAKARLMMMDAGSRSNPDAKEKETSDQTAQTLSDDFKSQVDAQSIR